LEGRTIDDPRGDSLKVVLTELAVEQLGLTNPIGQMIEIPSVRAGGTIETLETPFRVEVIGVVENFHFESLRQEMMPVIFGAPNTVIQRIDYYTLRIKTNNWSETIAKLQQINNSLDPENPLEYTFLDQRFQQFYEADQKRGQIFITLSIVVVLIACMGLFALVSYSIERRTKEIGIRKVLGASVSGIVTLVMREFLVLILAASVVGLPVAWLMMNRWLQEFAYRTPLPVQAFALALMAILVLAIVTVVIRTARAAAANPVKSLRSE
jgi:putative ABC transport system permease protein